MTTTALTVAFAVLAALVVALCVAVWMLWRGHRAMRFEDATAASVADALRDGRDEEAIAELLEYLQRLNERANRLGEHARELDRAASQMRERMKSHLQRIGVVRFDASDDVSGRLSCALCILDANDTGFLITTLYDRERSRTFIRAVRAGRCERELLDPERQALEMAMGGGISGGTAGPVRGEARGQGRQSRDA